MHVAIVFKFKQQEVVTSDVIKNRCAVVRTMKVSRDLIQGCLIYNFKMGLSAAASSCRIRQWFGGSAVD